MPPLLAPLETPTGGGEESDEEIGGRAMRDEREEGVEAGPGPGAEAGAGAEPGLNRLGVDERECPCELDEEIDEVCECVCV